MASMFGRSITLNLAVAKGADVNVALLYPEVYDMARFKEGRKEFPPFGVLYLAAAVRDAGHRVMIHKVTKKDPAHDLTGYEAVGFSLASSATYGIMLAARRRARIDEYTLVMVSEFMQTSIPATACMTSMLTSSQPESLTQPSFRSLIIIMIDSSTQYQA